MIGKMLDVLDKILSFFEDWTLFISVIAALLALFLNVVMRYGFNYTLAWSEELVREVIIYTTFIGCCSAVKKRSMIKIDASVQIWFPTENHADLLQQPDDSHFFRDDDGLRVANGRPAGEDVPERH
jgi:TRAP-type mannitol/chloroaromatic compound transport system permease small subunit